LIITWPETILGFELGLFNEYFRKRSFQTVSSNVLVVGILGMRMYYSPGGGAM
jgi:hypothetical protein